MVEFLNKEGLNAFWEILDNQNSEVIKRIKKIQQELNNNIKILYNTTEAWNSQKDLQSARGTIYIYSDYQKIGNQDIAGIKVGDGNAYLYDMPFLDTLYLQHIENSEIHITNEEREKWNNKVTSDIKGETLILKK